MAHDTIDTHQTGVGRGPLLDADAAGEALLELAAVVRTLFGVELAPAPAAAFTATAAPAAAAAFEPTPESVVTSEAQETDPAPVEVTIESWETSASGVEQVVASDQDEPFGAVAGATSPPDAEVVSLPAPLVLHAISVPDIAPTTDTASPSEAPPAAYSAAVTDPVVSAEAAPATDTATVAYAITVPHSISVPTEIPLTAVHADHPDHADHADHADHESLATDHSEGEDSRPIQAAFSMAIPLPEVELPDLASATQSFDTAPPIGVDTGPPPVTDAVACPTALPEGPPLAAPGTEPTPHVDPIELGLPIPAADVPALAATPDRHSLALLQEIAFLDD